MTAEIREAFARLCRSTPSFRGKGRIVLAVDHLLSRGGKGDSYSATARLNGLANFALDLRPWGQKFAYYYGEWEREHVQMMRRVYNQKGGLFIDIGSSLGLYTFCLIDLVARARGKIYSIEPVPFNLERQKKNAELNLESDIVRYFPCALGSSNGTLRLHVDSQNLDNNAYACCDGDVEVTMTTLDCLLEQNDWPAVGAIKMDIEGMEPDVIAGANETLSRFRPPILGEFHRGRMEMYGFSMQAVTELLMGQLDYEAFIVSNGRLSKIVNVGFQENIFFIPRGINFYGLN